MKDIVKLILKLIAACCFTYGFSLFVCADSSSRIRAGCWHRFGRWEQDAYDSRQIKVCEKCNIAISRVK